MLSAELFLRLLADNDDQQHDHQGADHRPNPHPSATPSPHPSVVVIHDRIPFVALQPTHSWKVSSVSGGRCDISGIIGLEFQLPTEPEDPAPLQLRTVQRLHERHLALDVKMLTFEEATLRMKGNTH